MSSLRKSVDALHFKEQAGHNIPRRNTAPGVQLSAESFYQTLFRKYGEHFVRKLNTFRPIKTKDNGRIQLAVALHVFGKYPTPKHLQDVWDKPFSADDLKNKWGHDLPEDEKIVIGNENERRRQWFITQATGGSLHKKWTSSFFTKKETHAFLTCPIRVTFEEAVLYALASSYTDDIGVRGRIIKSKLISKVPEIITRIDGTLNSRSVFWKEVIRFFCVNNIEISKINDLVDFLAEKRRETATFDLKGRTLVSLTHQMEQWHRDLGRAGRMGNRTWVDRSGLSDSMFEVDGLLWSMTQLLSSKVLADEGNKMHHCVYSYQRHCISGHTSIWSLKRQKAGEMVRALTIEIDNNTLRMVQVRGYANRLALPEEKKALKTWSSENNSQYSGF